MYQDIYYNWSTTMGYSSSSEQLTFQQGLTFQQAIRNKTLSKIIKDQITQPRYKDIISRKNLMISQFTLISMDSEMMEQRKDTYKPCFENVRSYATAFLFFIETETTVGKFSIIFTICSWRENQSEKP